MTNSTTFAGLQINGIDAGDQSGFSVSSAGDVNGDGFDDIIIGVHEAESSGNVYAGETYVVFGSADGFSQTLDLDTLDGTNGFRLDGVDEGDLSGWSVSSAGNVNGDAFDDIIISAPGADPEGKSGAGKTYVVFGKADAFDASLDFDTLDGSNGFRLDGIDPNDGSGVSVSSAGDVNGDGFDDVIIGAYFADLGAGETYVVFGKAGAFDASLDLDTLDGTNGFRLDGIDSIDLSGWSVSSAGDVNGDDFDDIIIGAPEADPEGTFNAGETYVVFGKPLGFTASLDLETLDGNNGFRIDGIVSGDVSGWSVSSAGDVNGDGFDDILIGAPASKRLESGAFIDTGETYLVFGKANGFDVSLDLETLDGNNGFRIDGIRDFDESGFSVSSAGDVNGDGFDDILIGAPEARPEGTSRTGESYLVFGKADGFTASQNLSDLDGTNGFRLVGIDSGDKSGVSVSSAGDVNGDGFDDILIGAEDADPDGDSGAGETYLVFGGQGNLDALDAEDGSSDGAISLANLGIEFVEVDRPPTGSVAISGSAREDEVLTADTFSLDDPNGLGELSYQWLREGSAIPGATKSSYTLGQDDVGATISVRVSYIDGLGTVESATSLATKAVENVNDAPSGTITLSGTAVHNGSLAADTERIEDEDGLNAFSYQWLRDGSAIEGENGDTYALSEDDVGKQISVEVSYTDGEGTLESVTSDQTSAVAWADLDLTGTSGADTLNGAGGNDILNGRRGNDVLKGDKGADLLKGGGGDDKLSGGGGRDTIKGGDGKDTLNGGNGADTITGGDAQDVLEGGKGNDLLKGDAGRDILQGNTGKDTMFGGSGADTFAFVNTSESKAKAKKADIIKDFQQDTDVIDLSAIDASTEPGGNDAFSFSGTTAFGTDSEGEIRYKQFDKAGTKKDYTMVFIDTDSDRGAEMSIKLKGLYTLTEDDFIL